MSNKISGAMDGAMINRMQPVTVSKGATIPNMQAVPKNPQGGATLPSLQKIPVPVKTTGK